MLTFKPIWPLSFVNYDLCFALYGTPAASSVSVSSWALYFGIFLVLAFVWIPILKIKVSSFS
jgi:hypothetical protein